MLQKAMQELKGDAIFARDGAIGSVADVYFDDERWAVRYLVVDTGDWLPGRKVLISPASVSREGGGGRGIRVELTREQVEHAPGTGEDPPISRLLEATHADHYRYPYYWTGPYLWGIAPVPYNGPPQESRVHEEVRHMAEGQAAESHLRSSAEVAGYRIQAADGEIGHVEDFLVDDESWAITHLVVDTRNWLPGKKVLVPPGAIQSVDWHNKQVSVGLSREEIKQAPGSP